MNETHSVSELSLTFFGSESDAHRAENHDVLWFLPYSTLAVVAGFSLMSPWEGLLTGFSMGGVHGGADRCAIIDIPVRMGLGFFSEPWRSFGLCPPRVQEAASNSPRVGSLRDGSKLRVCCPSRFTLNPPHPSPPQA